MTMDMTPQRWAALKRVLEQLLSLHPEEREAFLNRCDDSVRHDLTLLLAADDRLLAALEPTVVGGTLIAPEVLGGRYRIEKPLGRGGMGEVDLARDLLLNRPVAVKRLRERGLDAAHAMRRLVAEGRALAALDHPHIARVQDVLETSPPALVMEFVEGSTLEAWLDDPRPPALVLEILKQIVGAIAYAHDHGVVHCDIKPRNVIVTADSDAKVIDFGIALVRSAVETVTSDSTREKMYTPRYAAPEVIRGATPTRASDVYSLGVLIDDVVKACRDRGKPLPDPLADVLARVARQAQAEDATLRPRDAAAVAARFPADVSQARSLARWRMMATTTLVVCASCVAGGVALVGDKVSASSPLPIIAVVPRVDDDASDTVSAGAADLLRKELEPLTRARLAQGEVPSFEGSVPDLVKRLRDEGLSHVVIPTVVRLGSSVRMSVVIYRMRDGLLQRTFTRHGRSDAMQTLARDVASEVRAWLGEPSPVPAAVTTTYQPSPEAFQLYSEARQYSGRPDRPGSLDTARSLLQKAVALEPAYAAAYAELGRVLYLTHREKPSLALLTQALTSIESAVGLDPVDPDARITRAVLLQARGRRTDAIATLHDVLRTFPDNDHALRYLGRYEAAEGHVDAGVTLLERAVQLVPSWGNYQALGNTLLRAGRYAQAVACFESVTQLQPDNAWGYQMLGAALQYKGDIEAAARAYQRSIEIRPMAQTVSNLATLEFDRSAFAEAARLYTEALALEPHDPLFARNLGDAERMRGRAEAAADAYLKAVELARLLLDVNPNDAAALSTAAYASSRLGRCAEAAVFGARAESAQPGALQPLANVINAHVLCGRVDDAARLLRQLRGAGHDALPLLERDVREQVMGTEALRTAVEPR
jgi:serine/threonine protein kinase/Flp pilus assembly protein TadD